MLAKEIFGKTPLSLAARTRKGLPSTAAKLVKWKRVKSKQRKLERDNQDKKFRRAGRIRQVNQRRCGVVVCFLWCLVGTNIANKVSVLVELNQLSIIAEV